MKFKTGFIFLPLALSAGFFFNLPSAASMAGNPESKRPVQAKKFRGKEIQLAPQSVAPGSGKLLFNIHLPEAHKFTPNTATEIRLDSSDPAVLSFSQQLLEADFSKNAPPLAVPFRAAAGKAMAQLSATLYYCLADSSHCYFEKVRLKAPVSVRPGKNTALDFNVVLEAKPDPAGFQSSY